MTVYPNRPLTEREKAMDKQIVENVSGPPDFICCAVCNGCDCNLAMQGDQWYCDDHLPSLQRREHEINIAALTETDLIVLMFRCYDRLRQLGWHDAMYAPADGRMFEVIEPGSTGIHKATRDKDTRHFWIHDEFDSWPSDPCLYREISQ